MPKTVAQGFETFLSTLTPTDAQRTAGAKHRATVRSALEAKMSISTFFETGSFSHGTGVRGFSDTDVLASIGGGRPSSSDAALSNVRDALRARFPFTTVRVSRPAVVVQFAAGFETWEVIPGFLTGRGTATQYVYDIPGPAGGWIDTAPKQHLAYVNECNLKPHKGDAKALARLMKAWKYYCSVPISSFYLEMRTAQHVATQANYIHVWDVCQLLEKLDEHNLSGMNDPTGAAGRIEPCSSAVKKLDALSKVATAASRARKALDAYSGDQIDTAFYYLRLLFGGNFPAR